MKERYQAIPFSPVLFNSNEGVPFRDSHSSLRQYEEPALNDGFLVQGGLERARKSARNIREYYGPQFVRDDLASYRTITNFSQNLEIAGWSFDRDVAAYYSEQYGTPITRDHHMVVDVDTTGYEVNSPEKHVKGVSEYRIYNTVSLKKMQNDITVPDFDPQNVDNYLMGIVLWIGTDLRYREQGVASRLMTFTLGHMYERGVRTVISEYSPQNKESEKLHEKFGFVKPNPLPGLEHAAHRTTDGLVYFPPLDVEEPNEVTEGMPPKQIIYVARNLSEADLLSAQQL